MFPAVNVLFQSCVGGSYGGLAGPFSDNYNKNMHKSTLQEFYNSLARLGGRYLEAFADGFDTAISEKDLTQLLLLRVAVAENAGEKAGFLAPRLAKHLKTMTDESSWLCTSIYRRIGVSKVNPETVNALKSVVLDDEEPAVRRSALKALIYISQVKSYRAEILKILEAAKDDPSSAVTEIVEQGFASMKEGKPFNLEEKYPYQD